MRIALFLALLLAPSLAFAQGAVLQGGSFTAGHAPMYIGQGSGQAVVGDSGTANGGGTGQGLSELNITQRGTPRTPYGTPFCVNDAPTTSASGYHQLCLGANSQGGGLISYNAYGAASALPLQFLVNGAPPAGQILPSLSVTNSLSLNSAAVAGSLVRMYNLPGAVTTWVVQKPDGSFLSTAGTTTQGLQEAINYAFTAGYPLQVSGFSYGQPAGTAPTLTMTTTLAVPPALMESVHFDGLVILAAPSNGGPGVTFDSAELLEWDCRCLLLYRGSDYAVRFHPTSQNKPDNALAIIISNYHFTSVVVQNITATTPIGNVYFDPSGGSIYNNDFWFGEVCGSCGPGGGPVGQYGLFVEHPGASTFFENNRIKAQWIYGMSAAGVQVGPSATNQSHLRFNDWEIGSIQPNGASADGFNTFGSSDTGNVSVTNQVGTVNRAFVFEPSTASNLITSRSVTGAGSVYSNSGAASNVLIVAGHMYGHIAGMNTPVVSKQVPTDGFSITIPDATDVLLLTPGSSPLATGTIVMPANPVDGQVVRIASSGTVTALTLSPNSGQTVNAAPTALTTSTTGPYGYAYLYDLGTTTWFRLQ